MTTTATQLIWNGCDSYMVVEDSLLKENNIEKLDDGRVVLFTQNSKYESFYVVEVKKDDVPLYDDGEMDCGGLFLTECKKIFKLL